MWSESETSTLIYKSLTRQIAEALTHTRPITILPLWLQNVGCAGLSLRVRPLIKINPLVAINLAISEPLAFGIGSLEERSHVRLEPSNASLGMSSVSPTLALKSPPIIKKLVCVLASRSSISSCRRSSIMLRSSEGLKYTFPRIMRVLLVVISVKIRCWFISSNFRLVVFFARVARPPLALPVLCSCLASDQMTSASPKWGGRSWCSPVIHVSYMQAMSMDSIKSISQNFKKPCIFQKAIRNYFYWYNKYNILY